MTKSKTAAFITSLFNAEKPKQLAQLLAKEQSEIRLKEKEERAALLSDAKEKNVGIVHIFNPDYPYGGLSIAFAKVSPYKNGKMVKVAVATCSVQDTFSKKIGTTLALTMFNEGKTIELPILNTFDERNLSYAVKSAFYAMYNASLM